MPVITRIRTVGLKFDEGKKIIPDNIWEPQGKNTIFLLENGGGKTSIIQTLMQTVLPNSSLAGRNIKDTYAKKSYGHIAVEWLLDGENEKYLLTGFCFKNAETDKDKLDYFNYLFTYEKDSEVNIATLPFTTDKMVTRYTEFRKYLHSLEYPYVEIPDSNKKYKENLMLYGILPEEWESIRKINGDEGGVEGFFQKAKTTETLITKLLVPTMENTIFQTEEDKKEIIEAFKGYKENLLIIPEYQKDIEDFKMIKSLAEMVVSSVQELENKRNIHNSELVKIERLRSTLQMHQVQSLETLHGLGDERERLYQELQDWNWKKDSINIQAMRRQIQQLQQDAERYDDEIKFHRQQLIFLEQKEKELQSFIHYALYDKENQAVISYTQELEMMKKTQPELEETVRNKTEELQDAWSALLHLKTKARDEVSEKIGDIKIKNNKTIAELNRCQDDKGKLQNEIGSLNEYVRNYESELERTKNICDSSALDSPPILLENFVQRLREIQAQIKECSDHLQTYEEKLSMCHSKEKELSIEESIIHTERNDNQTATQEYETKHAILTDTLTKQGKIVFDLFAEKDENLAWLDKEISTRGYQRDELKVGIEELRRKIRHLTENEYFVPHHTLLEIKNRLYRGGTLVTLGSEWLADQNVDEETKELYLQNHPLLPYSFLIEEAQTATIVREMQRIKNNREMFEIPVIFQLKNKLSVNTSDEDVILASFQDGLMAFQALDGKLFTSREKIESMIKELKQELNRKEERLKQDQHELYFFEDTFRTAKDFHETYDAYSAMRFAQRESELTDRLGSIANELSVNTESITSLRKAQTSAQNKREDYRQEQQKVHFKTEHLKNFIDKYPEPDVNFKISTLKVTKVALEAITTKINEIEDELDGHREDREKQLVLLLEKERALDEHLKNGKEYQLDKDGGFESEYSEEEFLEIRITLDKARKELNEKNAGYETKQELLLKCIENRDQAKSSIEDTGLEFNWVQLNYRAVYQSERVELKKKTDDKRDVVSALEKSFNDKKIEVAKAEGTVNNMISTLGNDFGKAPYGDGGGEFPLTIHEIQEAIKKNREKNNSNEECLEAENNVMKDIHSALERYQAQRELPTGSISRPIFNEQEWKTFGDTRVEAITVVSSAYLNSKNSLGSQRYAVTKSCESYVKTLHETNNSKVSRFATEFNSVVILQEKLFDYHYIIEAFVKVFDALDAMENDLQSKLTELRKDKDNLVDIAHRRAVIIHENICEVSKHSKVELFGNTIQMVKIKWDPNPREVSLHNTNLFVEKIIYELKRLKGEGKTDDEVNLYLEQQMNSMNLLKNVSPLENCYIEIFKPRKKTLLELGVEYFSWDEAASWSGGERYTSYMIMFMIIVTHIRKKLHGKESVWKTIVADNPFGAASSEHVVRPIIELALKNKIQLFCLTAIREEEIRSHFEAVISNRYYNRGGVEILKSESEYMELNNIYALMRS
ncbi:hypothetical protein [Cohnella sp.]|uniref:hypothetical protein n=1 Tax=Cohnella sp. TaxID=1883426 RepID=UPI003565A4BB